jgi:hypothetical protein
LAGLNYSSTHVTKERLAYVTEDLDPSHVTSQLPRMRIKLRNGAAYLRSF